MQKKKHKHDKLTAESLKDALWDTLNKLRNKKIEPTEAVAVASTAREIMRVVRTEIDIAKLTGVKLKPDLLEPAKIK